jgi:hypothetical protein
MKIKSVSKENDTNEEVFISVIRETITKTKHKRGK